MKLPYRAVTASGETFDFEFPLHKDTSDPVRVSQLVTELLHAIDKDIQVCGETSNGDVLQALAMAMAIRGQMIYAPSEDIRALTQVLLDFALEAGAGANQYGPPAGHA